MSKIVNDKSLTEISKFATHMFITTQTDEKLRRENIQGKQQANEAHFEVEKKVRQTIADLAMPENLPTPEKSIKQIEKEINQGILEE